ncbi:MAG: sucrase ferredoxin [Actinomycetota bacterium]|nr:sucrase ferredoxin [Actinomycetota bacterium]
MSGTASTVRAFLLVEQAGPWGQVALRDSRLVVRKELAVRSAAAGVRVLLIRRHGRPLAHTGLRIFAAYADPVAPRLETTLLDGPEELLDLDLDGLRRRHSAGLPESPEPVFLICTHGRHDACCAERGRPAAGALATADPGPTWETSHIGGDRFAANLVVLPDGLYYGRVTPDDAVRIAALHRAGRLDLRQLRGRSGWATSIQAAELALRRHLSEDRVDAVGLVRHEGDLVRLEVTGRVYDVRLRLRLDPPARLTCSAQVDNPVPRYELLEITSEVAQPEG